MNNFETIIGIEIHIELNTKTKMFSPAKNDFNAKPNTLVHPIDLGYPGTLPRVNKGAIVRAVKLAKALNMNIDQLIRFDRKHYFYADLPKGYQITQNIYPFGSGGNIPIDIDGEISEIKLERFHLEEDTAKSLHSNEGTLLNYNRAGVPLIEIVTEPVIKSASEAVAYVDAIRELAQTLNISDAKMEEGSLRADINISLRPYGRKEFGTKVEIKNINTLTNIKKAIENEIVSQTNDLLTGKEIQQTTKRFDEETKSNIIMRIKTEASDYRFFPEPNIIPIKINDDFINSITINELPWERKERYAKSGLNKEYIDKLTSDIKQAEYFDSIEYEDKVELAKIFFSEIVALANKQNVSVDSLKIDPNEIKIALTKVKSGEISGKHLKIIIPLLVNKNKSTNEIIEKENMKQISDETIINNIIKIVTDNNEEFILKNKDRPERVVKFVLGNVMKESKGQANPVVANKLVKKVLGI